MNNNTAVELSSAEVDAIPMLAAIPLSRSVLCVECAMVYRLERRACPDCGTTQRLLLERIVNRKEGQA